MGLLTILMGAFLLFAIAFNGIVSESLYVSSANATGFILIILGFVITLSEKQKSKPIFYLAICTGILYLPVIQHRFTLNEIDFGGLFADAFYIFLISTIIYKYKPNKRL